MKKHFTHKKYKLLIEVTFKEGEFVINQKLNSFFGQIGIYEGGDKLINFIEIYFKSVYLEYLNYDNNFLVDHKDLNSKVHVFFLPITIYFYYGEKKCDFFINNIFSKRFYYDKKTISLVYNFLKFKQFNYTFGRKFFYLYKLKEYCFLITNFKNLFKYSKEFFSLLNLKSVDFFIDDDKTYTFREEIISFRSFRKKRILFFKKILSKSKNSLINISKKMDWFSLKFILNIIIHKHIFINFIYEHNSFFKKVAVLFSQVYGMKNKIFNKFKRYKKFKKVVHRNIFGKKVSYFKIYRVVGGKLKKNVKKQQK